MDGRLPHGLAVKVFLTFAAPACALASTFGDFDHDGYVGASDYHQFSICLSISGPGVHPGCEDCVTGFDADGDDDVDLADVAAFARSRGHLPMPLYDYAGTAISVNSTEPYSGRHTCGRCHDHDADTVSGGSWFQDGRTDASGAFEMRDDYFGDGRTWIKSAGRYGKWGQSFQFLLAAKDNTAPSTIDQTAFAWIRDCSGCHPGGGPGEWDRDGALLYDRTTETFGYETLGKTTADVALDGDYSVRNADGSFRLAPWDVTGLSGPDCLLCHRADRPKRNGVFTTWSDRRNTLLAGDTLTDSNGNPVAAFAAAGTAGQGWHVVPGSRGESAAPPPSPDDTASSFMHVFDPPTQTRAAAVLNIDYHVGVANGSLLLDDETGMVSLAPRSLAYPPKDQACWDCHPYQTISGTVWFDNRDVHYRKFNKLNDEDPSNDVSPAESRVCTVCHPGNVNHDIAKGASHQLQYRNELDWQNGFRTCRNCHLPELPDGTPNPLKHPDAPDVFEGDATMIHIEPMFDILSCQACHIPYTLAASVVFRDITGTGTVGTTQRYYSEDPLNPLAVDQDRWYYPSLCKKDDVDGVQRWFPCNLWISIYFADWNQNGTPEDLNDDVIAPIFSWRVAQATAGVPKPATGKIDTPEDILAFLQALKGNDSHGVPVALNPVLVRGQHVWYETSGGTIGSFNHVGAGIVMENWYPYIWGLDHNVLAKAEAWGSGPTPTEGCRDCHTPLPDQYSPVFDRKILVDPYGPPYGPDGVPVYITVSELTGLTPP